MNDTSVDGFLGNLREPEKFLKMDSLWNASIANNMEKPQETIMLSHPVGVLNRYEYTRANLVDRIRTYLNNGLFLAYFFS